MPDAEDEVRAATPPVAAWSHQDGGDGDGSGGKTSHGTTVVGLNAPVIPDYSTHDKLQTSHRGQYSIERMLALHDYCNRVSSWRAIAVCVVTPLPALVLAILLQLVPVVKYNPFTWADNTAFWCLTSILAVVFAASVTVQASTLLPVYRLSLIKSVVVTVLTAAAMVLLFYGVASAWMFPVPFAFVLGMAPFVAIWLLLFAMLTARSHQAASPVTLSSSAAAMPLSRFVAFLIVQLVMIVAFTAFEILLLEIETHVMAQKLTFLLYQSIRNVFKHTLACYVLRHAQDFAPELVVFSVELFVSWFLLNQLLVAYDEPKTTAVLITVLLSALAAMVHLNKRLQRLTALRACGGLPSDGHECLQTLVDALARPHTLDEPLLRGMRLRATGGHALPNELAAIVDNLQTMPALIPATNGGSVSANAASVTPLVASVDASSVVATDASATAITQALHQTLVVLFNTEYLVLVRYVETLAPVLYIVFVYVVFDLDLANIGSFPFLMLMKMPVMAAIHKDVGVHAALLIAMQVLLAMLLVGQLKYKRLGISPLHQLAFVLENQQLQIQAKLVPYMLLAVHFVMFQYGSDFHMKFAWSKYFP